MTANAFHNISQIESSLWEAADQLRANSKLTSSEYCMPVLGVIFLRHATNRYQAALKSIQADQNAGTMPKRPLSKADFIKRRALMLPEAARSTLCSNCHPVPTLAQRWSMRWMRSRRTFRP